MKTTTTTTTTDELFVADSGGVTYAGTPRVILETMREGAFDPCDSLEAYLADLAERVRRFHEVRLELVGDTLDERCATLIADLARFGFVSILGPEAARERIK